MLLRRITEHVKAQNWFAVGIDFLIVVVGVFIGLQVQQWSEARSFDAQENDYLAELREEIAANNAVTDGRFKLMTFVLDAGERAIAFLEGSGPCENDCEALLVDFFIASQVMYSPPSKTVYDEMQRLGLPRGDAVKPAVALYYQFETVMTSAIDTQPEYRRRVREHITVKAQRALWAECHDFDGVVEHFTPDCAPDIGEHEARAILDSIRAGPDLRGQLIYWIGMHTLWTPLVSAQSTAGEAAIVAIDEELGTAP